jgi:hypothetical protein
MVLDCWLLPLADGDDEGRALIPLKEEEMPIEDDIKKVTEEDGAVENEPLAELGFSDEAD